MIQPGHRDSLQHCGGPIRAARLTVALWWSSLGSWNHLNFVVVQSGQPDSAQLCGGLINSTKTDYNKTGEHFYTQHALTSSTTHLKMCGQLINNANGNIAGRPSSALAETHLGSVDQLISEALGDRLDIAECGLSSPCA